MSALFDHVTLGVSDIARARAFYNRIMPTLGVPLLWETATMQDFGLQRDSASARHGTHVAFTAPDRTSVDRFHAEALAAGGQDAGAPGLRPQYQGRYYAAFILDPDGNRIEAVFHASED
mgnify:FL=1